MKQDYPAAHSMDTEWFATDNQGNIGVFDSGEGGAIPTSNCKAGYCHDFYHFLNRWQELTRENIIHLPLSAQEMIKHLEIEEELKQMRSNSEDKSCVTLPTLTLPSQQTNPWIEVSEISDRNSDNYWGTLSINWLLWLKNKQDIPQLEKLHRQMQDHQFDFIITFAGEPCLVLIAHYFNNDSSKKRIQTIINSGYIYCIKPIETYRNALATLLGMYSYEHDYGCPFPYECDGQPLYPLKLENLPDSIQNTIAWNWFVDLNFAERKLLQPIESEECDTWGGTEYWVDTQGNEHYKFPKYKEKIR